LRRSAYLTGRFSGVDDTDHTEASELVTPEGPHLRALIAYAATVEVYRRDLLGGLPQEYYQGVA